ncbi:MAG: PorP/SprF family type IX secretion system membrane protein [Saprospiraceae bacterium]|nr:PorP/SprF family type IX secretion system membrane protein [Saprospiraceae bacterium]
MIYDYITSLTKASTSRMVQVATMLRWVLMTMSYIPGVMAQDAHFSQFYAVPVQLNPALTGGYDGKYRIAAVYRDQWRGPLEKPITTIGAALDLRFDLTSSALAGDAVAVGLQFSSDQAGPFDLSSNTIALSGAFHKSLDRAGKQVISAGLQLITVQRNVLYEDLYFQDQFDGLNSFNQPTNEDLPDNNFTYGDIAVGLNYVNNYATRSSIFFGGSLHHILEPDVSFYSHDGDERQQSVSSSSLFRKYSIHSGLILPTSENMSISPRLYVAKQGPHLELSVGSNFILEPNSTDQVKLHFGGWIRIVEDFDESFSPDVLGLMVGINLQELLIGLSYDLNLRDIIDYRTGQGALEVSISYFGNYDSDEGVCPSF